MTIYHSLLARGYFPKELPPAFFTLSFARYATSKEGRKQLSTYRPNGDFTECVKYALALPGLDKRELRIPHPFSYAHIAALSSKNLGRLLKKAAISDCSLSRPIYVPNKNRALLPAVKPTNRARERSAARAGASFLLTTDISHFYPSLYTHAIGWAVDPKLRDKAHWSNKKLLGKKLDQALMNLDGKISQGIPVGTDISFLLAEVVLGQVDKALKLAPGRAVRWFDDYEIAFDSRHEAESTLKLLARELSRFRLRINQKKTTITSLPQQVGDGWQDVLKQSGATRLNTATGMVRYFDIAFGLRQHHEDCPVMLYALGILFKIAKPFNDAGRIAESCITQALLCEPGCAQKAFALLSYWHLNGYFLNKDVLRRTIEQMVFRHGASGFSSDLSWALAFCIEQKIKISADAANILSGVDDDCIAIQTLHMSSLSLLPKGFAKKSIIKMLKASDLDREHWLLAYESVRHGFLSSCTSMVASNPLFSSMLKKKVTFYRASLPLYSMVVHPGGPPEWMVRAWMLDIVKRARGTSDGSTKLPIIDLIQNDIGRLDDDKSIPETTLLHLLDDPSFRAYVSESSVYSLG